MQGLQSYLFLLSPKSKDIAWHVGAYEISAEWVHQLVWEVSENPWDTDQRVAHLSGKGPDSKYLGSVITTQFCHRSAKTAIDSM